MVFYVNVPGVENPYPLLTQKHPARGSNFSSQMVTFAHGSGKAAEVLAYLMEQDPKIAGIITDIALAAFTLGTSRRKKRRK